MDQLCSTWTKRYSEHAAERDPHLTEPETRYYLVSVLVLVVSYLGFVLISTRHQDTNRLDKTKKKREENNTWQKKRRQQRCKNSKIRLEKTRRDRTRQKKKKEDSMRLKTRPNTNKKARPK